MEAIINDLITFLCLQPQPKLLYEKQVIRGLRTYKGIIYSTCILSAIPSALLSEFKSIHNKRKSWNHENEEKKKKRKKESKRISNVFDLIRAPVSSILSKAERCYAKGEEGRERDVTSALRSFQSFFGNNCKKGFVLKKSLKRGFSRN